MAIVIHALEEAQTLGAPLLRIFGGYQRETGSNADPAMDYADGFKRILQGIERCLSAAQKTDVVMALENHGRLPGHAYEIERIIRHFNTPWLRCCFDCANYVSNNMNEMTDPLSAYIRLAPYVAHVHIKDFIYYVKDRRRQAEACVPGQGMVPIRQFIALLEEHEYMGYCSLEYEAAGVVPPKQGVPQSLAYLRQVAAIHQVLPPCSSEAMVTWKGHSINRSEAIGVLRKLQKEDKESIKYLYRKSFAEIYPAFEHPPVLDDPYRYHWFKAEGATVALNNKKEIIGFVLVQLQENSSQGFLMTLLVAPDYRRRGIGSALLKQAESYLNMNGKTRIKISPAAKNHFCLGLELDSHEHGWFTQRGFQEDKEFGYRPVWMSLKVSAWKLPLKVKGIYQQLDREGISVRLNAREDNEGILHFTDKCFQGWHQSFIAPNFQKDNPAPISIALRQSRVIAFSGPLWVDPDGRGGLGAVGVDPEFRGKGLAHAVFNHACHWWQANGAKSAYLWTGTGNPAVKVYEEAGLRIVKTYVALAKDLATTSFNGR